MSSKIVFNGKEYPGPDAMPPEVRAAWQQVMGMFADHDGDGVPDLFQGGGAEPAVIQQSAFIVNGTAYPSVDAMPPETRRMYEQAMTAMEKAPILPAAQRRSHGDMSPRWGEERPRSLALPWVLVIVLLAVLAWVLLRQSS